LHLVAHRCDVGAEGAAADVIDRSVRRDGRQLAQIGQRFHDDALRIGLADDAQADCGRGQVRNLRRQEGIESGAEIEIVCAGGGPAATG
jgi:hypothetical protein